VKKILQIIAFLIAGSGLNDVCAQPLADIQFEKMDHSFGKIREEGGPAGFNFSFINTGTIPLIIQGVEASCGCTTPEWSREPILPGKGGFIKVSYNPEQRPGAFAKSITVNANVPKNIRVLTISGEVIPRIPDLEERYPVDFGKIRLTSGELSFVRIRNTEIRTDTLQFFNPGSSPVSVKFRNMPSHLAIRTVPDVIQPKSKGFFLITFDAAKKGEYGFITNRIYVSFNNEEKYDFAFKVSATIEEDFSQLTDADLANAPHIEYNSRTFDFKEIPAGKKVEYTFVIRNSGKKELIIRSVTASCGCTTGLPDSNIIKPGSSTNMKVTFDSEGKVGMQNKIITVISNDPAHATTILRVTGNVRK
jgi:hypothetical protein